MLHGQQMSTSVRRLILRVSAELAPVKTRGDIRHRDTFAYVSRVGYHLDNGCAVARRL